MKEIYCIVCLLLLGYAGQAQILNVEKNRIKGDSSNYFLGNVGLDFNINNQSVNDEGDPNTFIGLKATSDLGYISKLHSYLFLSQFQYNAVTNSPINSTGFGHFRINFMRQSKLSHEMFTQVQYDQGRGMQIRWIGGGNIRYRIIDEERANLYVGIGIMREQEVWEYPTLAGEEIPGETQAVTIGIWKSTNYLSHRLKLSDNADFNIIAYYQTGYDFESEFFRHRISTDLNLLIRVFGHLSFKFTAGGTYENRPIVPIPKLVYSVTNGLLWNF